MKKLITIALVLMLVVGAFTACRSEREDGVYLVAILQYMDHPALDAARNGFVGRLGELGFVVGENIQFIEHHSGRDSALAAQQADTIASRNPDLVLTIATGASQAMARASSTIPVVITAVTCPYTAGIIDSFEVPGRNVTGVSDLTPVAGQITLLTQLLPDAQVVGLLYNSGEVNSVFQANIAREAILAAGLTYRNAHAPSLLDVADVTQSLVGHVDVIYVPTCNTIAAAYAVVTRVATAAGVPVIVGESSGVNYGALATEGIDYYLLGRQTADMAAQILRGEGRPQTMPIEWQREPGSLSINIDTAERLGITIPADMMNRANIVRD